MQTGQENPDIILTDVTMPGGGGLSVLDRLITAGTSGAIPIIVLTGNDDAEIEARALAAGAVRVLRKPCDNAVLLDCIKTAFREGR
jgi:CheY-like chemotaxis protein